MTGTAIAQVIPVAISPILTRIYAPHDYGIFALYMSLSSLVSALSTGRYDVAIMLPERDEDSVNVAALAGMIVLAVSMIALIIFTLFNATIAGWLGNPLISKWLYVIPLTVILTSGYQILNCWSNRKKEYQRLALSSITASAATAGTNITMGLAGMGSSGLVLGNIIGQGVSTGYLWRNVWKNDRHWFRLIRMETIRDQARRFHRFPLFSLPADFINVASNQVPVLLLNFFFGPSIVGFFSFTQRVLGMPVSLLSSSIVGVFRERASKDYNSYGNCREI